jgi:hypothetical protein
MWRNKTYIYARLQLVTTKSMDSLHVSRLDQILVTGTASAKLLALPTQLASYAPTSCNLSAPIVLNR